MRALGSIIVAQVDRIAYATLHWPVPSGGIHSGLLDELEQLVAWIEDENPCDALVLRVASTPDDFSVPLMPDIDQCRRLEKLLIRVDRLGCITIAAVDGLCVRMWMQLALACDHRIATSRSSFEVREVKEGYLPGMNIFRIAKYVGIGVARRLVFTGAALDSRAAEAFGVVDEVCEPADLDAAIQGFVARLSPIKPLAAQLARRLIGESFSTAFENFLGQYLASQHRCLSGDATRVEAKVE